jgi:hypothetical protein
MESQKKVRVHKGHITVHPVPFPSTLIPAGNVIDSRSLSRRCVEASKFENTHKTRRVRIPCAKLFEIEKSD